MSRNIIKHYLFALFAIVCIHHIALAQDTTSGLYVCTDADGMNNIVTQAQLSTAKGDCKPYKKGMFRGNSTSASNGLTPIQFPSSANTQSALPPATNNPLGALGKRAPLNAPATSSNTAALPLQTTPQTALETPTTQANNAPANPPPKLTIYMCPMSNGTHEVVEAIEPPHKNCLAFNNDKSSNTTSSDGKTTPKTTSEEAKPLASAEIATLETPPQDIYKCFDHMGRASYVGANERHKFKQCSFFSKSFAGAQVELKRKATANYTLAELAASGVDNTIKANAALQCTGAGKIEFNGATKVYNCAARSFNYSPGSSGGSITLGDKQAVIAAHRLDYFDSAGSCGGTVLAENGRVLHLEPTKECPEAFKIEAKRIAKMVEQSLSIKVSGAFKDRQRALAPQINQIAAEVGVDPFLIHAVISAESAYKSKAVSHAGAQGLMQLMPATAKRFGVTDSFHTGQNIRAGTTYLKWLLKEFNGNLELAIAGYNAGEGNVRKYGYKIPPFIETRAYVPKVLEYYSRYRSNPSEVGL